MPAEPSDPSDPQPPTEFDRLLDERAIEVVFQPLVRLDGGGVVGYEALARGPIGSAFASPVDLFAAARRAGRLGELDWACRAAAFDAVLAARLAPSLSVFTNVEPESLSEPCPDDLTAVIARAETQLRVFLEFNDLALEADPAGLLAAVARARHSRWGVSLDDVGARLSSLALLPLMHPDVIKVDVGLLRDQSRAHVSAVVNAVLAHRQYTDVSIAVEGIETLADRDLALTLGATIGQGFLLGPPAPLPETSTAPMQAVVLLTRRDPELAPSPFATIRDGAPVRMLPKAMVESLARHLEDRCLDLPEPPVLLASIVAAAAMDETSRDRYAELAKFAALTVVFGVDMPAAVAPDVLGVRLPPSDPLGGEFVLSILGADFAVALAAREHGRTGRTEERAWEVAVTYDRAQVSALTRSLLMRVGAPEPDEDGFVDALVLAEPDDQPEEEISLDLDEAVQDGPWWRSLLGERR